MRRLLGSHSADHSLGAGARRVTSAKAPRAFASRSPNEFYSTPRPGRLVPKGSARGAPKVPLRAEKVFFALAPLFRARLSPC